MRKTNLTGSKGLLTTGRMVDAGANGYLSYCKNVLIREDGVMTPRFGLNVQGTTQAGITSTMYDTVNQQTLRASYTANILEKLSSGSWTSLDNTKKYGFEAISSRDRTYVLSNDGLRRITAANTSTETADIPQGLDPYVTVTGSTGWMGAGTQAAYVVVLGIKNADNDFDLGAPSGRFVVSNSATTACNTTVNVYLPAETTADHFVQVYRTAQSGGITIDPGADYRLVYEVYPTAGELSARALSFADIVSNSNGGAALYTNESEQTSLMANYPCEAVLSSDGEGRLAYFSDCVFASNYKPRSSIYLALLSVQTINGINAFTATSTTNSNTTLNGIAAADWARLAVGMGVEGTGIPANTRIATIGVSGTVTLTNAATGSSTTTRTFFDVITIGGVEYYAYTSESVANRQFLVPTLTSTSDPYVDVRQTCESFIRVFNRSSSNTIAYAQYLSGPDQLPGRMVIRCRTDRASTYTIQSTHGQAWGPNLATAQTIKSVGDKGTILVSKPNTPTAWPLVSSITFTGNAEVYEMVALRSALLVFTNNGIYRVTGLFQQWNVDLVDANAILVANLVSAGIAVVDNIAYCITSRGVIAVTETSTKLVSQAISCIISNRAAYTLGRMSAHAGDGYIFVPIVDIGTYVFHPRLGVWTMLEPVLSLGSYDRLNNYMVFYDYGAQLSKRQSSSTSSVAYMNDSSESVTVNSISGSTLTLSAPVPGTVELGDVLLQGSGTFATIEAINGSTITVSDITGYTTGAAFILVGYDVELRYAPITGGPGARKNWVSGSLQFDTSEPEASAPDTYNNIGIPKYVSISFTTDLSPTAETVSSFADSPNHAHEVAFWLPTNAKRATAITVEVSWRNCANYPRFVGVTQYVDDESDKVRR
jgi:hypothetical protein